MTAEPGKGSTFRVGLIQTRAGEQPAANLDTVVKLLGEAKAGGASYVQTPEMTNIMVASRDKLLVVAVSTGAEPPSPVAGNVEVRMVRTFFASFDFTVWMALPA